MDANKVRVVTLDEIRNLDPTLINYMTFTDGTVAIVNSDKEDENEEQLNKESKNEDLNKEEISQDDKQFDLKYLCRGEKEPDVQKDANMYFHFGENEDDIENEGNKNIKSNNEAKKQDNNYGTSRFVTRKNINNYNNHGVYQIIDNRDYKRILNYNSKNINQHKLFNYSNPNLNSNVIQNNISYNLPVSYAPYKTQRGFQNQQNNIIINSPYSPYNYNYTKARENKEYSYVNNCHNINRNIRNCNTNEGFRFKNNVCPYCMSERDKNIKK